MIFKWMFYYNTQEPLPFKPNLNVEHLAKISTHVVIYTDTDNYLIDNKWWNQIW